MPLCAIDGARCTATNRTSTVLPQRAHRDRLSHESLSRHRHLHSASASSSSSLPHAMQAHPVSPFESNRLEHIYSLAALSQLSHSFSLLNMLSTSRQRRRRRRRRTAPAGSYQSRTGRSRTPDLSALTQFSSLYLVLLRTAQYTAIRSTHYLYALEQ